MFLEHGQTDVQEQVVISLSSQVVEHDCHPSGHLVIVKCIKISSDQHLLVHIENICKETTAMVRLARDQYGHMVVLTMLFRTKQNHNTLRTAILVRQVAGTEFGREVIKIMKTMYSSLTGLWVVLLCCVFCKESERKIMIPESSLYDSWQILSSSTTIMSGHLPSQLPSSCSLSKLARLVLLLSPRLS